MELTSALLPMRLRIIEDSGIASAMSTSTRLATSSKDLTFTPSPPSKLQRVLGMTSAARFRIQVETLLDVATDHAVRARLLAACSPGSGDWLDALPLSSVGLKLDNTTIRIAAGLRLGAPIVQPHVCVCGSTVTMDGHHGLSCRRGSGRHARHNHLNDLLCRAFISTGTVATRKPHSMCTSGGKRPDGVTQMPWKKGRCLVWDATSPNTFATSYVHASSTLAGSQRRRQISARTPSMRISSLVSTLFLSSSKRPAYGASRHWSWWRRSDDGWRKSTRSHVLRRSYVSDCRSLFSAETLCAFWELCVTMTVRNKDRQ